MIEDLNLSEKLTRIVHDSNYVNDVVFDQVVRENGNEVLRKIHLEPVSIDKIYLTENLLGFRLPPILRFIYSELSNGLIGPGLGLRGIYPDAFEYIDANYREAIKKKIKINQNYGDYSGYFFKREIDGYESPELHDFFWIYGTIKLCDYEIGDPLTEFSVVNCMEDGFPIYRMDYFSIYDEYKNSDKNMIPKRNLPGMHVFGRSYFECDSLNEWLDSWCESTIEKYNISNAS